MNTWLALFKREWLEHRGGFGWAPVGVFGVLVVVVLLGLLTAEVIPEEHNNLGESGIQKEGSSLRESVDQWLALESINEAELTQVLQKMRHGVATPFSLVYFGVAFFVLLGGLFDDRRDRSVLFWKSVPVSDTQTVLSKLITVVWLAPLVTIAMIVIAHLFLLIVASVLISGSEHLSLGALWSHSGVFIGLAELVVGFIIQGFWALPLWGWLLLVSAVATRLPFLWAVFIPVVPVLLEWVLFRSSHILDGIHNHFHARALPTLETNSSDAAQTAVGLPEMFALWATSDMWLGIVVGAVFLAGAIYFRRRNNEM